MHLKCAFEHLSTGFFAKFAQLKTKNNSNMFKNIPTVTRNLLLINIIAFFGCILYGTSPRGGYLMNEMLGLHFFMASEFHLYQLLTYMFMHASFEHLFFNMFALWMFGCIVERAWGPKRYLFYYLFCGIGAGLMQELAQFFSVYASFAETATLSLGQAVSAMHHNADLLNGLTTVGASGAIYAILLAFGMIFPNERIFIFPLPVPIKAKYFVIGYAALELLMAFNSRGDGVAHLAHLGGMLFGFFLIRYWQKQLQDQYRQFTNETLFRPRQNKWHTSTTQSPETPKRTDTTTSQRTNQAEIDAILDKIRRSGYESLTYEEKQKLFEHRQ